MHDFFARHLFLVMAVETKVRRLFDEEFFILGGMRLVARCAQTARNRAMRTLLAYKRLFVMTGKTEIRHL